MDRRIGGIHLKWYQRHVRHLSEALEGLEAGDHREACFHAYQSVVSLLNGILGFDPYAPAPTVKALPALIKKVQEKPPESVLRCATCLERNYYDGVDGERCVKCAELITDYLHTFIT
ncbi:MAG: HEPN domain-containing protein [Pyrobaculum sp.]